MLFTLYSPELVKAQEELLNASRTGRTGLVKGATERLVTLGVDRAQIKAILKRGKASQTIEIKAPANGVIASLSIREGGYLSPAQAVISAGPLNNVWVDAEVFERQAQWIKAGSEASMTLDAIPGNEWQGKVDYVYPILDLILVLCASGLNSLTQMASSSPICSPTLLFNLLAKSRY